MMSGHIVLPEGIGERQHLGPPISQRRNRDLENLMAGQLRRNFAICPGGGSLSGKNTTECIETYMLLVATHRHSPAETDECGRCAAF
jgi:hypothetical protein